MSNQTLILYMFYQLFCFTLGNFNKIKKYSHIIRHEKIVDKYVKFIHL